MLGIGFTPTAPDPSAYTHGRDDTLAILLLTVSNEKVVQRLLKALMGRFEVTDMSEISLVLGMSGTRDYDKGTRTIS